MLPLTWHLEGIVRGVLRRLPLSDDQKTRLWATSLGRPRGRASDWPYYRCIELATRALVSTPGGHSPAFQGAGNPERSFSMLEFGVGNGDSLQVLLHFRDVWSKRLRPKNKIVVLGLDTFEGIPAARPGDEGVPNQGGDFSEVNAEELHHYLSSRFSDFQLVKGLFRDTLKQYAQFLREHPPVFVSVDCDYYSSTMDIFEHLLPDIAPHGCLFYFDDVGVHFWSEQIGELRAIVEVNEGKFGPNIRLTEYPLWIETRELRHYRQVYALIRLQEAERDARSRPPSVFRQVARDNRISPL